MSNNITPEAKLNRTELERKLSFYQQTLKQQTKKRREKKKKKICNHNKFQFIIYIHIYISKFSQYFAVLYT